jgi:hypothetical protein
LKRLDPQLEKAIEDADLGAAAIVIADLQDLLRPTQHFSRLAKAKNKYCELLIEKNKLESAEAILLSNRNALKQRTRTYLETSALLAVCYIQMQNIEKARPYIAEVLNRNNAIKTEHTREKFVKGVIDRFSEEAAFCTLRSNRPVDFDDEEILTEVVKMIQKSDSEILETIGKSVPRATKELILMVYDYSTKQIEHKERKLLPSPNQKVEDVAVGETVFQTVNRVIYRQLCLKNGMPKTRPSKGDKSWIAEDYIRTAVVSSFCALGITHKTILIAVVALATKIGIGVYCERNKPVNVMDLRAR